MEEIIIHPDQSDIFDYLPSEEEGMKPRFYQLKVIEDIKQAFRENKRNVALNLCGGSGKSLVAKLILDLASQKGSKIAFFSYRLILINQIKKYNIPNCDIGTLQKFGKQESELYDVVIVDESWGENSKLKNNIRSKFMITLTGTPFTADGYALPNYDCIINGIQFPELVELGYAKKLTVMGIPFIDTKGLKTQGGDYSIAESFNLMSKSKIHSDIIGAYKKYATDRKVMAFGVNIQHCEDLKEQFIKNGITAETVHSKKKTDDILERFDKGLIKVLISVSKLNVGYDNHEVNCIMMCRPTKSIPVLLQTVWRGTRLNPNKPNDDCLLLDLTNCVQDTIHPMNVIDLNRTKEEKGQHKCSKCSQITKLIDRKSTVLNEYEYCVTSTYKCSCENIDIVDNIKVINQSVCESCFNIFESLDGIQMKQLDKSIVFETQCKCYGHKRTFRELLLTDDELKEIRLNDAMNSGASWEDVLIILKKYCADDKFKWQYALRLQDHLKNKNLEPKDAIELIKRCKAMNKKISFLMVMA